MKPWEGRGACRGHRPAWQGKTLTRTLKSKFLANKLLLATAPAQIIFRAALAVLKGAERRLLACNSLEKLSEALAARSIAALLPPPGKLVRVGAPLVPCTPRVVRGRPHG